MKTSPPVQPPTANSLYSLRSCSHSFPDIGPSIPVVLLGLDQRTNEDENEPSGGNYKLVNKPLVFSQISPSAKGSGTSAEEPAPTLLLGCCWKLSWTLAVLPATGTPSSAAWATDRNPAVWGSQSTPHYQKCSFYPLGEVPKTQQRERGKKLEKLN